jgi:hypothetical protein
MKIKELIIILVIFAAIVAGCGKNNRKVESSNYDPGRDNAVNKPHTLDSLRNVEVSEPAGEIDNSYDDSDIINDPAGQWAMEVKASSSYVGTKTNIKNDEWSPKQLIGKPDVEVYGNDPKAWAAHTENGKPEWVRLKYPNPVYATEVRIRENYNPGAVSKVELIDTEGIPHVVWNGTDTTKKGNQVRYFIVRFKQKPYKTNEVKISLSPGTIAGWEEIDAVQLVGN